ncbi:MAG: flagellar motor protein MotB [Desulfobacteraceae bacterium]|jgi:chemotaxis protein MotB
MSRKGKKGESDEGGTSAWMVTFSDLSTLLLTFFVLLLSMSSMDERKLKSLMSNFTSSCGILLFKEYGEIYHPKEVMIEGITAKLKDTLVVRKADDPMDDLSADMEDELLKKAGGKLEIEYFKEGFKLVFGDGLLFGSGSAEILEDMKPVLKKVVRFMRYTDYQVYIDGHTDDIPIRGSGGEYASNQALSQARAMAIRDYFLEGDDPPEADIALIGYGALKPVAPNDTPDGRSKNRRVEVIFKNKKYF